MEPGQPQANVHDQLFKDEDRRGNSQKLVFSLLVVFNLLLTISFWIISNSLLAALLWSIPIGISFTILLTLTLNVGSKTFLLNFIGILFLLISFTCIGIPRPFWDVIEKSGIPSELLILGSLAQFALFYGYTCFQQIKGSRSNALDIKSEDIRIEKKLTRKKPQKETKKKSSKTVSKKFKFARKLIPQRKVNEFEPEIYRIGRREAVRVGIGMLLISIVLTFMANDPIDFMPIIFFVVLPQAAFFLAIYLMLVSMIKPGTKKFWMFVTVFGVVAIPTFIYFSFIQ